ncbi:MAG: hypothetical protein JO038_05250 [Alphaproteobacteria bacterium]|nr:hypothetical protein [Alphaproteobacteria bacterium]
MSRHSYLRAIPVLLLLAACQPAVSEYTPAEAPNQLTIDSADSRIDLRFAAGTDQLAVGEWGRLARLASLGAIRSSDRVTVSAAGAPGLADRRVLAVARALQPYGVLVGSAPLAAVPADHALLAIGRYLVTLPPCPNWSAPPAADFTNQRSSNLGCATASNLGMMVANPADLIGGQPHGPAFATPAAAAVGRYLTDRVQLPSANQSLPISSQSSQAPGGAGGSSGSAAGGS